MRRRSEIPKYYNQQVIGLNQNMEQLISHFICTNYHSAHAQTQRDPEPLRPAGGRPQPEDGTADQSFYLH
jgi:hypothetical protein